MVDTSKYTIEERLIATMWFHDKERTGETYEEIRENFFLVSIKQLPVKPNSRSPNLTTCDNWLWSYLKENLSIIQMDSVEQLKSEIIRIFRKINPDMLRRASRRTWRRIQLHAENDGAHTETLDV